MGQGNMPKAIITSALEKAIITAIEKHLLPETAPADILVQRPADPGFGDYSTNLALTLSKAVKRKPREVAEILLPEIKLAEGVAEKVEIAGAGFINFFLHPRCLWDSVTEVLQTKEKYGRNNVGKGQKILLEYVSANPTGPVGVVQGRAGAIGDVLANLLTWSGFAVDREFYVNDALNSGQMQKFADSLAVWYLRKLGREAELPEDGYQGDYVGQMAEEIAREAGDRYVNLTPEEMREVFRKLALDMIVAGQKTDLGAYGVEFENWFWESSLYETGAVEQIIERLKESGNTYEADGALWIKTTDFGHGQDEVLVRSNESPTYLAADLAYHLNKFSRGYDQLIDIWGPDHHGHISRTKAAIQALGYTPDRLHILMHQIVRLFREGEMVRMSKRAGDIVPLKDLLEEVGPDATRYFFLMRSAESHLDFHLDLAKKQSSENPVYYVQYAHARICSVLRQAEEKGVAVPKPGEADLSLLTHARELDLMRQIIDFPEEVELAATLYEPHRLTRCAQEIASDFHLFYTDCRILGDDPELTKARLALLLASEIVLKNILTLIGVTAPERM